MNKYQYKVTGDYRDWLEMKKGNTVIHNGSLIGLIAFGNNKLEIRLNYGLDRYYLYELKFLEDFIITVPVKDFYDNNYIYVPLVFNNDEYKELIEICYIDKNLLKNVKKVNKGDVFIILLNLFKTVFGIKEYLDFSDITNNIICFSQNDEEIKRCLNNFYKRQEVNMRLDKNGKTITTFVEINECLYEWNAVVKIDDNYYFKFVDDYLISIS